MPVKKPEMFRFAQHDSAIYDHKSEPDEHGHWGKFGGRYVPETLVAPLEELTNEFTRARHDDNFWAELNLLLRDYAGRPTPLFHAQRLSTHAGGAQIYLKREDLLHTGAHKINNALGQALLARRMGKASRDCRDRRRPARRRDGNGLRTLWIALRHLHGRGRCTATSPERFSNAIAWCRSKNRQRGHTHAEGRDQRGATRLGDERPRHLLPAWAVRLDRIRIR